MMAPAKTLVFLIDRAAVIKFYGPVIEAALTRNWQVEFWQGRLGEKIDPYLDPEKVDPGGFVGGACTVRTFTGREGLRDMCRQHKPDAIFSMWAKSKVLSGNEFDGLFVTLPTGIDNFVNHTPQEIASSDLHCLFSPFWLDWAAQYYEAIGQATVPAFKEMLRDRIAFTGLPQVDVFNGRLNPQEIKARWRIESDRPVVLLLPTPLQGVVGAWTRFFSAPTRLGQSIELLRGAINGELSAAVRHASWVARGFNNRRLMRAISDFCKRNGAYLIVKGRQKDPAPDYLTAIADKVLYDDSYWPATIHEALSIADLCIHFYSTATLEAAAAGVYALCLHRPSHPEGPQMSQPVCHRLWRQNKLGSAFNFDGVNALWDIPQAIRQLSNTDISSLVIDEPSRQNFIRHYLGYADGRACHRVLDAVEQRMRR